MGVLNVPWDRRGVLAGAGNKSVIAMKLRVRAERFESPQAGIST